jgi:hypothetical protein
MRGLLDDSALGFTYLRTMAAAQHRLKIPFTNEADENVFCDSRLRYNYRFSNE